MKELLVPVGNMESLVIAIHSGADAVYLGGKKFGARAYANNFNDEEMIQAIKMCHLYGVKIYVTVNTLIYESELEEAINYLIFLHTNGVDAVIVQDIGLISAARKILPNLEIHASTQVHNTNEDTLKLLEELGVKRVVLARELSLNEINNIKTNLEKEVFIHGALCVSYSGECLFSSLLMDRSGNRGCCAQICRLPFKLLKNDEEVNTKGNYLLSTKELNTSSYFKNILESDIVSLKIEGRMKSPEYVGCVTRLYRDLIDKYNNNEEVIPDEKILKDLEVIFNRKYTKGFLFNSTNEELMNIETQNHLGVHLGNIINITKKYIYIKLDRELNQGDGIRFNNLGEGMIANFIYDKNEKLINKASSGEIILIDNKFNIKEYSTVNKTLDIKVKEKYLNVSYKRIPVRMIFKGTINGLTLEINDYKNKVIVTSDNVELAKSMPIDKNKVSDQLSKLGNTPFFLDDISISLDDNLFINIKELNDLRREAINKLITIRENVKKDVIINTKDKTSNKLEYDPTINISILCRTEEQLKSALQLNVDRIYLTDYSLYKKYQNDDKVFYRSKRVGDRINVKNTLATELGSLYKCTNPIGDYYLNVCNHYTVDTLMNYSKLLTLSVEIKNDELERLMNYYNNKLNVEFIIYSNIELMITKYCPLNLLVNKTEKCHVCSGKDKYYLKDRNNKNYRILNDADIHLTHILNSTKRNLIDEIDYYIYLGINNYRIELLDEDFDETKKIIESLQSKIKRG